MELDASGIVQRIIKQQRSNEMAQRQIALGNFLTSALLLIVFVAQSVFADLAPNEDEEEVKPSPDLKKLDESMTTLEPPKSGNLGFIHAFIASFSVIMVSEIGDKTFFIAAIMSMVSNKFQSNI